MKLYEAKLKLKLKIWNCKKKKIAITKLSKRRKVMEKVEEIVVVNGIEELRCKQNG